MWNPKAKQTTITTKPSSYIEGTDGDAEMGDGEKG